MKIVINYKSETISLISNESIELDKYSAALLVERLNSAIEALNYQEQQK